MAEELNEFSIRDLGDLIFAGAADVLDPPPDLEVWDWAEANIVLSPRVTAYPGPLRLDNTPYMRGEWSPLWAYRRYSVIDNVWAAQTGKTLCLQITIAYDSAIDPGPGMIVYPDIKVATRRSQRHLIPFLRDSLPWLIPSPDALTKHEYDLSTCTWVIAWAGSPSVLAGEPVKHLKLDEEGKFPRKSAREADPKRLALRRLISFGEFANCYSCTTPSLEADPGWRDWAGGDDSKPTQCQYFMQCPDCGHWQVPYFNAEHREWFEPDRGDWRGGFHWPEAGDGLSTPERIARAWYQCESCLGHWDDGALARASASGQWRPQNPNAKRYASNLPSWVAPWVKLPDVVERWYDAIESEGGRHDFLNSDCAIPYRESGRKIDVGTLRNRLTLRDHHKGHVPDEAVVLVLLADVQDTFISWRVRAFAPDHTSWGVEEGMCAPYFDHNGLGRILDRQYKYRDGRIGISWGLVDSGWRTDEVYQFCLAHDGRVFPTKGFEGDQLIKYSRQLVVANPEKGLNLTGEVTLVHVNDSRFKDQLFARMEVPHGSPGAWYVEAEASDSYWSQLGGEMKVITTEGKTGRPVAVWKRIGHNHSLDCEKQGIAAITVFQLGEPDAPEPEPESPDTVNPYTGKPVGEW